MQMNLEYPAVIAAHAAARPNHPAVADRAGVVLDYQQLLEASTRFATLLRRLGVSRGDRVAIAQNPCASFFVSVIGTMLAGAVVAPLHLGLSSPELRRYVEPLDPRLVVADSSLSGRAEELGLEVLEMRDATGAEQLLEMLPVEQTWHKASEEEPAMVFPTGGTTGQPKGAVLTHRATWLWVSHLGNANRRRTDVELSLSPLFHVTLLAGPLSTLFAGGTVRVLPRFDLEAALEEIEFGGANTMAATPTVFRRLLSSPHLSVLSARMTRLVYGASGSDEAFVRRMLEAFPSADVSTVYGATEFGSVTKVTRADLESGRLRGVGRPVPAASVEVVDEALRVLPRGTVGEVLVSAPWQATKYWGLAEESARTFTDSGIRLGDVGSLDEDGWLMLNGRIKEMIITGGENVFPGQVEEVLARHPAIADVTVYGVPDDDLGEHVEAAVIIGPGMNTDAAGIIHFASSSLGRYKLPKVIRFVLEIPTTANNKPDRRALARQAAESTGC